MALRDIRKSRGLTQADLADMAQVEQSAISRIENEADSVTLRMVKQVATALDVPVSEIFAKSRSESEAALLRYFRSLPPDRQQGWVDIAILALNGKEDQ